MKVRNMVVHLVLFIGVLFLVVDNYLHVGVWFQLDDVFHHETLVVVFVMLSFFSYFRSVDLHSKFKLKPKIEIRVEKSN